MECINCTVACVPSCTLLSSASQFWKITKDRLVKFLHVWFAHLNNQKRELNEEFAKWTGTWMPVTAFHVLQFQ